MKLYNFKRLIKKYSVPFQLRVAGKGKYVAGKWEESGDSVVDMVGAIVPMSEQKIYSSDGTYTAKDRELYLTKAIGSPLSDFQVIYDGNIYSVETARNYEAYADVAIYTLKWVSKA